MRNVTRQCVNMLIIDKIIRIICMVYIYINDTLNKRKIFYLTYHLLFVCWILNVK